MVEKVGLYWHFIDKHKEKLSNNHRMAMIYKTYGRRKEENIETMKQDASTFLAKLTKNEEVWFTHQNLSGLSKTIYVAQKMGKELGKCTLLLQALRRK